MASNQPKVAVVTPYYREPAKTLRRCIESVRAQTYPEVSHYLVADGVPQPDVIAEWPHVRHIILPNSHANFGNTPRGVGAQCALADDMDVVCYLDADNLLLPGHVASVVGMYQRAEAAGQQLDAVFSSRYLFLPGHEHLRLPAQNEGPGSTFVDTNCISLSRSAGFLWGAWCQLPRALAPVCDRAMCWLMQHHRLNVAWTGEPTVLYESNWRSTYLQAGLVPPAEGLHDDTLVQGAQAVDEQELWALLRVRWSFDASAPAGTSIQKVAP